MSYNESHQELGQHPKTRRLARLLGVSLPCAVGHLQYLWWWALDYADDGDLSTFDDEDIADAALWEGDAAVFVSALAGAGFLDRGEDGDLSIHDWDDYGGKVLARIAALRDRSREREARRRARMGGGTWERVDRERVIAREGPVCYMCHAELERSAITLDHIIPLALGGPHTESNLKVACRPCNSRKGVRPWRG